MHDDARAKPKIAAGVCSSAGSVVTCAVADAAAPTDSADLLGADAAERADYSASLGTMQKMRGDDAPHMAHTSAKAKWTSSRSSQSWLRLIIFIH